MKYDPNSKKKSYNMSVLDGILRLFGGMIFASVCGALYNPIGILAIYPIVTAMTAWDPIYAKIGKYTCEENPYGEKPKVDEKEIRAVSRKLVMAE